MPSSGGQAPASQGEDKGVISQLQEFIQGSKDWKSPAGRPVLDWNYDERKDAGSSEFRATVTFVLDGVPHHVAGEWFSAKHLTKRDLAERVLRLYVTTWGEQLLQEGRSQRAVQSHRDGSATQAGKTAMQEMKILEDYVRTLPGSGDIAPRWSLSWSCGENQSLCQAIVEVTLHDVAHKFMGGKSLEEDSARVDTARRTLWYLQCPGYEEAFELDPQSDAVKAKTIPAPPTDWIVGMTEQDSAKVWASTTKACRGPQETTDRKLSGGRFARNAGRKDRAFGGKT